MDYSVLYTFRERPVAFSGDIREMFHQVKIMEKDTPAQRFLWRDMACSSPPEVYQMEVMIFGAVSSPCSAQFAKKVNAQRFADTLPEAVDAILKKHYMDDYLDSADTELEAMRRVKEVIHIHEQGGFEMRNWISSSRRVLQAIPEHLRARGDIDLNSGTALPTEQTLGVRWNRNDDCFVFALSPAMRKAADEETLMTKRHLLRTVMSVFDPIGFLACFTVSARKILQDVWRDGIGWDDELPATLRQKWTNWCAAELLQVTQIKIPRCYFGRENRRAMWNCMCSWMPVRRHTQPLLTCEPAVPPMSTQRRLFRLEPEFLPWSRYRSRGWSCKPRSWAAGLPTPLSRSTTCPSSERCSGAILWLSCFGFEVTPITTARLSHIGLARSVNTPTLMPGNGFRVKTIRRIWRREGPV